MPRKKYCEWTEEQREKKRKLERKYYYKNRERILKQRNECQEKWRAYIKEKLSEGEIEDRK